MSQPPEQGHGDGHEPSREAGYWRSLAELRRDPAYQEHARDEFSPYASLPLVEDAERATGMSRRRFLALAGASAALAAAGCERLSGDRGEIVPYVKGPEGTPPGQPRLYASALLGYPGVPPVLITTREGRPIKLEGNPEHPSSLGALGAYGQSATLALYDPDRIKTPRRNGSEAPWDEVDQTIRSALAEATQQRKRILLITPALVSPTTRALVNDLIAAYPTTRHLPIETFHRSEALEGHRQAFGAETPTRVNWANADAILSVGDDFLGTAGNVADQRAFAARRRPEENPNGMNRLWVVEGAMSVTGTNADHRITLRPSLHGKLLLGLLHAVVMERRMGPLAGRPDIEKSLMGFSLATMLGDLRLDKGTVGALVKDLAEHPARSAILAGDHLPAAFHTVAAALNVSLGNFGSVLTESGEIVPTVASPREISDAVAQMASGSVAVVIVLGANPVYALPGDFGFAEKLARVPLVVSSSLVADETAEKAHVVLPAAHDLESWGDSDVHDGVLTLQQPAIKPLFATRQYEDSLLAWLPSSTGRPATYHDYLKRRWQTDVHGVSGAASPFEYFWNAALHDGFLPSPVRPRAVPTIRPEAVVPAVGVIAEISPSGSDLLLVPGHSVYDGRFADNGWLQELPHPITSHVWTNGALMSLASAENLGVKDGDAVSVTVGGRSVSLPVIIVPGVADDVVCVELGYGRWQGGSVGSGVGVNAGLLRSIAGGISPWIYTGATVTRVQGAFAVARTQEHHNMEGRAIILEGTASQYRSKPDFVLETVRADTTASPGGWAYETGQKWGMAIDLSLCTGCNGCSIACTAENNVPVVGPEQVAKGREMQWIRIDHYYKGTPEAPQVVHQVMLCQHCDNAPCENVCPVAATAHSRDGLNEMTYNRCVGTRYCANNCPYKVRRFNYFNFHENLISPQELLYNPEVTVRSRGVMEKCTFCVQRIREGQHAAKREGRAFHDGDVKTACQQACPTQAIVFGDVNDPDSRVHELKKNPRGYHVLSELGTKPSVTYLAKIRNPHPDLIA